jgi:TonB family protein
MTFRTTVIFLRVMVLLLCLPLQVAFATKAAADERAALKQKLSDVYKGKTVMLRGNYCGESLKYDAQGKPLGSGQAGDWTVCRDIRIEKVRLDHDRVRLSGRRILWFWSRQAEGSKKPTQAKISKEKDKNSKNPKMIQDQNVTLEVALPPQADQAQVESLLGQVFWPTDVDLRETKSSEWTCDLKAGGQEDKNCPDVRHTEAGLPSDPSSILRVGPNVTPPRAIRDPNPAFSDQARRLKFQGIVVLAVVIDREGNVAHVQIVRALGLGLDAKAAEQVRTWKFEPAKRDGVPVPVLVTVEVSFNLY